jgi:surface protein
MDYNAADDILVLGTLGRGAWSIKGIYTTLSNPSSIKSLTLRFTTGTPPTQVTTTQEIPLSSINLSGSNSVPITDTGILAAFNDNPEGTSFTYSIAANYGNTESGNAITSVTSPASNIPSFVPRPPPVVITRATNNVTIQYTGTPQAVIDAYNLPTPSPLFIQANPRGTPQLEWFAVVTDDSKAQITSYAKNEQNGINYFTTSGGILVLFNNIVTTRMTDMSYMFFDADTFNLEIDAWDTSSVTNMFQMFFRASLFNRYIGEWNTSKVLSMGYMFFQASSFNKPIGEWDTSKVETMFAMFYEASAFNNGDTPNIYFLNTSSVTNMNNMFYFASAFNKNISAWNVTLVTPKPPTDFRTGSALITDNMPPAFR